MLQSGGPIPSSQFTTMPPYQGAQGGTISTIQMATMMAGTSHATPPMQRGPQQNMSLQRQQQHHYPPPMEPPAPPRPYPPKSAPGPGVQIDEPHLSRSQSMGVQGAPSDSMMQQRGGGMGMGGGGQSTMPKNEPKQDLVQGYAVQGYAPPVQVGNFSRIIIFLPICNSRGMYVQCKVEVTILLYYLGASATSSHECRPSWICKWDCTFIFWNEST